MYCSEQAFVVCFSGFLTYFCVYITQLLSETARIRFRSQVEEEKRIFTIWYMSMKLLLSSVPVYCMETLGHNGACGIFFWLGLQAGMHEAFIEVLVHPVLWDPEVTFIKEENNSFHMSILCVFQWSS